MILAYVGIQAQTKKIVRVHDTNLFELEDGRMIKMAGIEMPPKDIPGGHMGELAEKIYHYERNEFEDKEFDIIDAGSVSSDTSISLVYLTKRYRLESTDYNENFLKQGYGRFVDNTDSLHGALYRQAESEAVERKNGMWAFRLPEVKDTLERKYSLSEISYLMSRDSLYHIEFLRKRSSPMSRQIAVQAAFGSLMSCVGIMSGAAIGAGIFYRKERNSEGEETIVSALIGAAFGSLAGYMFSAPLGVYLSAKPYNPSLSYWPTLLYSTLFTGVSIGLVSLDEDANQMWIIPSLMPLIGSMIYVNCIAPNPVRDGVTSDAGTFSNTGSMAFKDVYNRQMQFRVNILTLSF